MVFVPGCFWIARTTARFWLYQAAVLSFSTLFSASPISSNFTGAPFR